MFAFFLGKADEPVEAKRESHLTKAGYKTRITVLVAALHILVTSVDNG
ncbi:MAG: hypothetical protein WCX16_04155 [Candidatus Omnitrophota bacterium]|jgi:hypothetical protein